VSRLAIQILFILLAVCWFAFSAFMLLGATLGDCGDLETCGEVKDLAFGLVFWRWVAGCLILFGGYRFFRKDRDVL
jgi:hypothetical protein